MKEMIREIILDSLDPSALKQAIASYVESQMDGIDTEDIVEELLADVDIFELAVEAAAELLLPF